MHTQQVCEAAVWIRLLLYASLSLMPIKSWFNSQSDVKTSSHTREEEFFNPSEYAKISLPVAIAQFFSSFAHSKDFRSKLTCGRVVNISKKTADTTPRNERKSLCWCYSGAWLIHFFHLISHNGITFLNGTSDLASLRTVEVARKRTQNADR